MWKQRGSGDEGGECLSLVSAGQCGFAGLEEDPCGSARGQLAIQPQHLLQANGCYNLINVMKLDIIP